MPDKKPTEGTTPIDYEGTLKSLTESYYNALDSINRLQAEVERLEAEIDKQYEIAEANVRAEIASGGTSCHWCEDKVRAEAYKEFAERLKEKSKQGKGYLGNVYHSVDVAEIDNLLKEMVGDNQ